jgi:hypothetical protein
MDIDVENTREERNNKNSTRHSEGATQRAGTKRGHKQAHAIGRRHVRLHRFEPWHQEIAMLLDDVGRQSSARTAPLTKSSKSNDACSLTFCAEATTEFTVTDRHKNRNEEISNWATNCFFEQPVQYPAFPA